MAKAMVKCKWCGQSFDRNSVPCVKINGRRYGHKRCIPPGEENNYEEIKIETKDDDLTNLEVYIMELFNKEYIPPRIRQQIKQYHEEYNYSYSGIQKSLQYFFEIKHNPVEGYTDTIGIVPYIYDKAKQYFYALYMAQLANQQVTKTQTKVKVVTYEIKQPIQRKRDIKLFDFEEDEE